MYSEHLADNLLTGSPILLLAGYSGVGKSTAVALLEKRQLAVGFYAGSVLADELAFRGIERNPENERKVREELRCIHGMAVFANRSIPHIMSLLEGGCVVVDSVYCTEELNAYRSHFGEVVITLGITSGLDNRTMRLARRRDRRINLEALLERDEFERKELGLDCIIQNANHGIANDGSLAEFEEALHSFAAIAFGC